MINDCSNLIFWEAPPILLCTHAPCTAVPQVSSQFSSWHCVCSVTQWKTIVPFSPQTLVECTMCLVGRAVFTILFTKGSLLIWMGWRIVSGGSSGTTPVAQLWYLKKNRILCSRWHLFSNYYCFSLMFIAWCYGELFFLMFYKAYLKGKVSHCFLCTNC